MKFRISARPCNILCMVTISVLAKAKIERFKSRLIISVSIVKDSGARKYERGKNTISIIIIIFLFLDYFFFSGTCEHALTLKILQRILL